jgi:DnaK suppressor protein
LRVKFLVRDRLLSELALNSAELAQLRHDHLELIQASQSSNADDEHDPEGATIAFEREQLVAITARIRQKVTDLQRALRDVDDGRYGVCRSCGEPIDPNRLEIRPHARVCVRCAELER